MLDNTDIDGAFVLDPLTDPTREIRDLGTPESESAGEDMFGECLASLSVTVNHGGVGPTLAEVFEYDDLAHETTREY